MLKNLTQNQIVLIALASLCLFLAALSFSLLRDPSAPLPFVPASSATFTPLTPSPSFSPAPSYTSLPTRRTSYTPFAPTATYGLTSATSLPSSSVTQGTSGTPSPAASTPSATSQPTASATLINTPLPGTPSFTPTSIPSTPTPTLTSIPATATLSPTPSATLTTGEYVVTGRIIQNGTPMPNVVVWFEDDVAPRQTTTDAGGHYSFITLAPGTHFTLTFNQNDNHQLTPASQVTSLAWIEGTLPTGVQTIQLPDFEISLNLENMVFETLSPVDGATYSAANISASTTIPFLWSLYGHGGSYHVELGPNGSSVPAFSTSQLAATSYTWDGTLNNGTHISSGAYWWRVAVTSSLGAYVLDLFTQPMDILFNP